MAPVSSLLLLLALCQTPEPVGGTLLHPPPQDGYKLAWAPIQVQTDQGDVEIWYIAVEEKTIKRLVEEYGTWVAVVLLPLLAGLGLQLRSLLGKRKQQSK